MMIYLAAPYSHPDPVVKQQRIDMFYEYDAKLSQVGLFVVSPLYKVETAKRHDMPSDWEYWKEYCLTLLGKCDKMVVLKFDGWDSSPGVTAEIEFCNQHLIPIVFVDVD